LEELKPVSPVAPVKPEEKKYSLIYTDNAAKEPKTQDQEYPVASKLNWNNPLKGLSVYNKVYSYQFVSLDGTRSAFDDSECKGG
jgi:hypothetical protein